MNLVDHSTLFVLVGYKSSQITVLTMYNGQRLELIHLLPREAYPGLRVTVVDNYQGEENDIVLLSLVRSNREGRLGFLATQNRILVSLSRARIGLFVLGDFEMLASNCEHWAAVVREVRGLERELESAGTRRELMGSAFTLFCQNHPQYITKLGKPEDIKNCPEGNGIIFIISCIISF